MNLKLFRSVRFNVGLFAVLAAASALGTFLPQRPEAPAKVDVFLAGHPKAGPLMDAIGLFDVYHSYWYVFLLGLMAFDVVVCKLRKFPRDVHAEDALTERLVEASPLKDSFLLNEPAASAAERVRRALSARRYILRERKEDGGVHLWAARHGLQRWGDFLLHVSIVAVLAGGLIGGIFGFEEFLPVTEGGVRALENRPWTAAVDDFEVEFYEGSGAARKYASRLRVLDGDREVGAKRIVVNEPLDIGGVRFYQASWGMTGMLRSATLEFSRDEGQGSVVPLPWRKKVPLRPDLLVAAEMSYPDFVVTESGQADTRGLEPNNPAVLISFYNEKEERLGSLWLLQKEPHVGFKITADGTVQPAPHPPFRLKGFDPILFSGLQVAYDPGVRIVGWGCVALLAGLALHFYFHQRRLRILLTPEEGGTRVRVGGWSSRHPSDFEPEFRSLAGLLQGPA